MASTFKRTRLWVDPAFQFRLLARMGFYMLGFAFLAIHMAFFFEVIVSVAANGPSAGIGQLYNEFLYKQRFLIFTLILILPILLYDLLRFSNRIAGPLFRCRRIMQEMADGKPVTEFVPRKHDLMKELFQAFNALIKAWNKRAEVNVKGIDGAAHLRTKDAIAPSKSLPMAEPVDA